MLRRCTTPTNPSYPSYGGRGVKVCDRWKDSFENFLADMGPRPEGCSLDRIDNDGNYTPENCRWSTRREQNRNTQRTRMLTHPVTGVTRCLKDWARTLGITHSTLRERLARGWTLDRALT
jgi:hypothetical protein